MKKLDINIKKNQKFAVGKKFGRLTPCTHVDVQSRAPKRLKSSPVYKHLNLYIGIAKTLCKYECWFWCLLLRLIEKVSVYTGVYYHFRLFNLWGYMNFLYISMYINEWVTIYRCRHTLKCNLESFLTLEYYYINSENLLVTQLYMNISILDVYTYIYTLSYAELRICCLILSSLS